MTFYKTAIIIFITIPAITKSQIYKTDPQTVNSAFQCVYRSPSSLQTSSTNFVNQKFNDSAIMLTMFITRLWILSRSTSNPASSFAACLFNLAFCHCAKILKDHFVTCIVSILGQIFPTVLFLHRQFSILSELSLRQHF